MCKVVQGTYDSRVDKEQVLASSSRSILTKMDAYEPPASGPGPGFSDGSGMRVSGSERTLLHDANEIAAGDQESSRLLAFACSGCQGAMQQEHCAERMVRVEYPNGDTAASKR